MHFPSVADADDEDGVLVFDPVHDSVVSDPNPEEAFGAGDDPRLDGPGILLQLIERGGSAATASRRELVECFYGGAGELDLHADRRSKTAALFHLSPRDALFVVGEGLPGFFDVYAVFFGLDELFK